MTQTQGATILGPLAGHPINGILQEVNAALKAAGLEGESDFANINRHRNPKWPANGHTIAVYAKAGSNEGWYVNIDVLSVLDSRNDFKTYAEATHIAGMKVMVADTAWAIARETARLLEDTHYHHGRGAAK